MAAIVWMPAAPPIGAPSHIISHHRCGSCGASVSRSRSSYISYSIPALHHRRKKGSIRIEAMKNSEFNSEVVEKDGATSVSKPDHLLVLVHGILASPSDWKYFEVELKRRLGPCFHIYASSANSYTQTLHGIDVAGRRLAAEVQQVITKTPSLRKISFLAHSLGGLFARYAVAVLYKGNQKSDSKASTAEAISEAELHEHFSKLSKATISGLEAVSFITLATPHLGVRGKRQLPFLLGVPILETLASSLSHFVLGRTGGQLFLTDGKANRPPLLLRMTSDCEDGKFISALAIFRTRILYANVSYDHMVGWRTSSIRRESEIAKPPKKSLEGYKHVINEMYCPPVLTDAPSYPPETAQAKKAAQTSPSSPAAENYYDMLEEQMIRGLQRVGWKKVDVSFHSTVWPFFAHNNIHVKQEWIHYEGAGVVAHVIDNLKQQEMPPISANL